MLKVLHSPSGVESFLASKSKKKRSNLGSWFAQCRWWTSWKVVLRRITSASMGFMSILSIRLGICNLPRRCARGMYCRESRTTRWISDRESLEADAGLQWSIRYVMISWRWYYAYSSRTSDHRWLQYSIPHEPRSKAGLSRGRNRDYDLTQYENVKLLWTWWYAVLHWLWSLILFPGVLVGVCWAVHRLVAWGTEACPPCHRWTQQRT